MDSSRNKPVQVHLVTPEEPKRSRDNGISSDSNNGIIGENSTEFPETVDQLRDSHAGDDSVNSSRETGKDEPAEDCFMPSIKNTRKLETEILVAIQYLRNHDSDSEVDRQRIVELLNRSLTAISHWSLQAQLTQLRRSVDDRQAVETNLLRKEMEMLISKRSNESISPRKSEPSPENRQSQQQQQHTRRIKPKSPPLSISTAAATHSSSSRETGNSGPTSPTTPQKKVVRSPTKRHPPTSITPNALVDPVSLRLVESKKPHPRMRRTSDNPMTNEYVRVFHLQRK